MSKSIKQLKNDQGFTLIELLIVVLIIGILAAIAIPVFLGQRQKAANSAAESTVRNASTDAQSLFTSGNGTYTSVTTGALNNTDSAISATQDSLATLIPNNAASAPNQVYLCDGTTAGCFPSTPYAQGTSNTESGGTNGILICAAPSNGSAVYCMFGNGVTGANSATTATSVTNEGQGAFTYGSFYNSTVTKTPPTVNATGVAGLGNGTVVLSSASVGTSTSGIPGAVGYSSF